MRNDLISVLRSGKLSRDTMLRIQNKIKSLMGGTASLKLVERKGLKGIKAKIDDVLVFDLRVTNELSELYLRVDMLGVESLKVLGLEELAKIFEEHGLTPTHLAITRSLISGVTHLIIGGDSRATPNIRIMVKGEDYDVLSSYCRISRVENTCDLLRSLLGYVIELVND